MSDVANAIVELPWHNDHWQRLLQSIQQDRLPHAILLTGAAGLGKHHFANRLAAHLLCNTPGPTGWPCGQCRGCLLFKAGTHPDYLRIEPEEPGKAIRIDAIREFTEKESLTSQMGGYKVIIIEPADALNVSAANSLLKTLEEPVAQTLLLLTTDQPNRLPATIRSRCSLFNFKKPPTDQALDWLATAIGADADPRLLLSLAHGAPLEAVTLSDPNLLSIRDSMLEEFSSVLRKKGDPLAVAAKWEKTSLSRVLQWVTGWVVDMLKLQVNPNSADIINIDQTTLLRDLGRRVQSKRLHQLLDQLYQAKRNLGSQLNTQMLLEGLLLEWSTLGELNE